MPPHCCPPFPSTLPFPGILALPRVFSLLGIGTALIWLCFMAACTYASMHYLTKACGRTGVLSYRQGRSSRESPAARYPCLAPARAMPALGSLAAAAATVPTLLPTHASSDVVRDQLGVAGQAVLDIAMIFNCFGALP